MWRLARLALVTALLAIGGCASVFPYGESYPANVTFSSPGLSRSLFSSPKVSLHVFFDEGECDLAYRGSVVLGPGDGSQSIGLPTDRVVFARIWAQESDWLRNRSKTRSDEFRLEPRKGHRYAIEYTHKKNMYGRRIVDTDVRTGRTQEILGEAWGECAS